MPRPSPSLVRLAAALVLAGGLAWTGGAAAQREPATSGAVESVRGCEVAYHVHPATHASHELVAILAHGYMRNGSFMTGWGEAIAASGVTAVTVDLCASDAADGRPADNAADLIAVRRALGAREAIYVGVSAGGLAALIAASLDAQAARGLLLLDPVNAGGQARSAAGRVDVPVAALVAKPQMCNAWRNIDPALETLRDATTVRIGNASHCDFEWPSDRFCRIACVATNSRDEREQAQARIRRLGVAYVQAVAEGSPAGLARWRGEIGHD
jgi:hypothetical protein